MWIFYCNMLFKGQLIAKRRDGAGNRMSLNSCVLLNTDISKLNTAWEDKTYKESSSVYLIHQIYKMNHLLFNSYNRRVSCSAVQTSQVDLQSCYLESQRAGLESGVPKSLLVDENDMESVLRHLGCLCTQKVNPPSFCPRGNVTLISQGPGFPNSSSPLQAHTSLCILTVLRTCC